MDGEFQGNMPKLPASDLPDIPAALENRIAIDYSRDTVFVQKSDSGNTHLLTWIDKCRVKGRKFKIEHKDLDHIAFLRETHQAQVKASSPDKKEETLENRDAALALLFKGASYNASDIHIILRGTHTEIQFREDGELAVAEFMTQVEGEAIIRAFYQGIATIKEATFTPTEVQNAQISGGVLQGSPLTSVRIVRGPAFPEEDGGGFMVLRLQYGRTNYVSPDRPRAKLQTPRIPEGAMRLGQMGYKQAQIDRLEYIMEGPSGLTIFTGPTGSGKTTSLFELLKQLARRSPGKRILTIEDPVEYPMSFAIQLAISQAAREGGRDFFAEFLRHALRMDPDTIFLGELRSVETFLAAFQAAMTGHRVPSTVHVEDPFSVPDRIEIMDPIRLPRKMFCNSKIIRGIINQRLAPLVCPTCSVKLTDKTCELIPPRLMASLKTYGNLADVRLRGEGCDACHYKAIKGRRAVAEVIHTDQSLMHDFIHHGPDEARRKFRARSDTDNSILYTAMEMVLAGELDPRDVGPNVDVVVPKEMVNA
jgi:type II secretory ATPase GspE/PulE/Tfp pilus assembly ATPase PilB-like protein